MSEKSTSQKRKTASTKSAPQPSPQPTPERTVDEVLHQLEEVVEALEAGDLPLEAALTRFEEGVRLVRQGNELLDRIEQRVEVLLADRDTTVPFPSTVELTSDELDEDD